MAPRIEYFDDGADEHGASASRGHDAAARAGDGDTARPGHDAPDVLRRPPAVVGARRTVTDRVASGVPRNRLTRRTGWAIAVAVAIAVLVVVRGGQHASERPTRPSTSVPASTARESAALSGVLSDNTGQMLVAACPGIPQLPGGNAAAASGASTACSPDLTRCPEADDGQNACTISQDVPPAVLSAVDQRFPTARLALAQTETVRQDGALWFRELVFDLPDRASLRVDVVLPQRLRLASNEGDAGNGTYARAVHVVGTRDVVVLWAGPSGADAPLDTQFALARDHALLTT